MDDRLFKLQLSQKEALPACSIVSARERKINKIGRQIPSFKPLSTLSACLVQIGTGGLLTTA